MEKEWTKLQLHLWAKEQERKKINRRSKADHRHKFKGGREVRIFGAQRHIHCTVKGCDDFKVVG